MVTGLYGALAAAASVFIGILTALLASNLSNLKAERGRIKRRIEAIDSRLRSLRYQKDVLRGKIEDIEEMWREEEMQSRAEQQVEEFIEFAEGNIELSSVTPDIIQEEFADFIDVDAEELSEYHHQELQENLEDIRDAITPDRAQPQGLNLAPFASMDSIEIPPDPEITAMHRQIENQWEIRVDEKYTRNERQYIQTVTEIGSLRRERQKLVDRYQSLDPSEIKETLIASIVTIGLSVGGPLTAYLLHVITEDPIIQLPLWVEPTVVFGFWAFGLGYVFHHLRDNLSDEDDPLPEEPEFDIDENAKNVKTEEPTDTSKSNEEPKMERSSE